MSSSGGKAAELRKLSCAGACKGDVPKLGKDELEKNLEDLPAWEVSEDHTKISRKFVCKNFVAAIDFFNQVKDLAEAESHHPDLHLTGYRNVQVDLQTHSVGGVTLPDVVMAAKLDALPVTYSPKWLREHGSQQPGQAPA
ncbi:hypothetical protein WJX73_009522 [Symbiochloris irregularis]|uniref:4a-hydroxytetrahydrobiopterin dehydratase n=1 Tax=Symbiochloris irregularis TaxID=706552 RepID=A0AAW1NKI2_9CHLO